MTNYHTTADGNIPFTPEEEEEWSAMAAAAPQRKRESIQLQIDSLERNSLENRGARELHLQVLIKEAAAYAEDHAPMTQEQVLSLSPYYLKLKALNDTIIALRAQL